MSITTYIADTTTDLWRVALRHGYLPLLTTRAIRTLLAALDADDPRLTRKRTSVGAGGGYEGECIAACAIGFAVWMDRNLTTADDVEAAFAALTLEANDRLADVLPEHACAATLFLRWHDTTHRAEVRYELAGELRAELERREAA